MRCLSGQSGVVSRVGALAELCPLTATPPTWREDLPRTWCSFLAARQGPSLGLPSVCRCCLLLRSLE